MAPSKTNGLASDGAASTKVAIVTGATSGMGIDIAAHLHKNGWKVAIIGRNVRAGQHVAHKLGDENVKFFSADVSNYQSLADMFSSVWKTWGRIDLLCANAGIVDKGSLFIYDHRGKDVHDVPREPDLSTTDINYKGVIYGTQLAIHFMRHNPTPGGKIIVNGSIAGIFPHPSYPEYNGSKAAVINFVRGAAPLLKAKENIYLNVVLPGIVATPIVPPEMVAAVSAECITPVSTIIRAHDKFIQDDTGMTGKVLEASADQLVFYDLPEHGNGHKTRRAVTVWEPLFRMAHGESSDLPDAIA